MRGSVDSVRYSLCNGTFSKSNQSRPPQLLPVCLYHGQNQPLPIPASSICNDIVNMADVVKVVQTHILLCASNSYVMD